MKNTIISLFLIAGMVSSNGFAAGKTVAQQEASGTVFGLGLATFGSGSGAPVSPAMSASLEFGPRSSLQILASVNNSDPFEFSAGSLYRYNLFGNQDLNWNIGFGFNLGTMPKTAATATGTSTTDFYMNLLLPTTGVKFALGGALSNVKLSFDGGVMMHLTPSPFKMYLAPLNSFLGASIHYYFL